MANVLAPFGFRHIGYREGFAPTMGMKRARIASGNTHPIFHGDAVIQLGTGYIDQPSSNALTIAGVFQGCEYFSTSQQRMVRMPYWPGSDATGDINAFLIDTINALFVGQTNGTNLVTFADVGANIGVFVSASAAFGGGSASPTAGSGAGNTTNGLSGMLLDSAGTNNGGSGVVAVTATLPFRIVAMYSDYVLPGTPPPVAGSTSIQGADNASAFNWIVVAANNFDQRTGLGTS